MEDHNMEDQNKIKDQTVDNQDSVVPAQVQPVRKSQRTCKLRNYGNDFLTYLSLSTDSPDPSTIEETLKRSDHRLWIMKEKIQSLKRNQTWELIEPHEPQDKRILDTK